MGEIKKKKIKILFFGFDGIYICKIICGGIFVSQNFSVDQAFFD